MEGEEGAEPSESLDSENQSENAEDLFQSGDHHYQ